MRDIHNRSNSVSFDACCVPLGVNGGLNVARVVARDVQTAEALWPDQLRSWLLDRDRGAPVGVNRGVWDSGITARAVPPPESPVDVLTSAGATIARGPDLRPGIGYLALTSA